MATGRNEPCWCGSRLKYKNCHYQIDTAPTNSRLQAARRVYDINWKSNAAYYTSQGCYEWMASQLKPYSPKRILDIGCGDGSGIIALLKIIGSEDLTVFSLEENSECARTTQKHLDYMGYSSMTISRMVAHQTEDRKHELYIEQGKLLENTGVTIIESDILLNDEELLTFLLRITKFDAITVWLIGSHQLRCECSNIAALRIQSSGEYRLRVQNKVYELADKILKPGGVLQIVDRGEVPNTEELKEDTLNAHRDQASVTSLKVQSLDYIIYKEPDVARKIKLTTTLGLSGRIPDLAQYAMISIISIKP
ncbi:MAG: SEC-C metal-binding domain-containing protein [Desulfobaccales bacterium]